MGDPWKGIVRRTLTVPLTCSGTGGWPGGILQDLVPELDMKGEPELVLQRW